VSEALRDAMPPAYGPLLSSFFDRPTVAEPRATCDDCAMCDKSQPPAAAAEPTGEAAKDLETAFFHPVIKCCTYHPTLPNYLVGAILSDEAAELSQGKERVRAKIARRIGVTPYWLAAPRKYLVLLDAARESSFGRSEALLCPYYVKEGGRCSIWRHRESVCATFFCKHAAGATGHAFWTALRRYLFHVERSLARLAAHGVAPHLVEPDLPRNLLTRDDLEDKPPGDYARIWQDWAGREEAFYVECKKRVDALDKDEFSRRVDDAAGKELLCAAAKAYEAVTAPKLGPRLVRRRDMRVVPAAGGVGVTTYSRYDSLFLTQDLYDLLGQFNDEPLDDVVARLSREHDVEIPRELLLELQLHGVLAPPEEPTAP
jgi:Fe-S-cluster containining protein